MPEKPKTAAVKKLTKEQTQALRYRGDGLGKFRFTEEELAQLEEGRASFKVMQAADKELEAHRKYMNMPISRLEAGRRFTLIGETQDLVNEMNGHLTRIENRVDTTELSTMFLVKLLVAKGVFTMPEYNRMFVELQLASTSDVCEECQTTRDKCEVGASDITAIKDPETGEELRVVGCEKRIPKEEAADENS